MGSYHMEEIWKSAGAIAGIGGLSIAMIVIIFRSIVADFLIEKSPELEPKQVFVLLKKIIIFTFIIALAGIAAWGYGKWIESNRLSQDAVKEVSSHVVDATEEAELEALSTALIDLTQRAIKLERQADANDDEINNLLGERAGWNSQTRRMVNSIHSQIGILIHNDRFSSLPDGIRALLTDNKLLEKIDENEEISSTKQRKIRGQAGRLSMVCMRSFAHLKGIAYDIHASISPDYFDEMIALFKRESIDPFITDYLLEKKNRLLDSPRYKNQSSPQ